MFSSLAGTLVLVLSLFSSVHGAAIPSHDNDVHEHDSRSALPALWYHDESHPAHALFRRQATTPSSFPQVGSATWASAYPAGAPVASAMPQAWIDALNVAVQANKIPNIPQSVLNSAGAPTYNGANPSDPSVCSGTYGCRIPGNIYDAPAGVMGLSFDDGPLPPSGNLNTFLRQNQVKATHFYIGTNILANWNEFNTAFQTNQDDIAVHTWTHPYMTTLSNEDVVAQLGWTLQLIYNSTGGRICRFWRPPYGDTDMRVNSIAEEVFGLTAVIWNQDTGDWNMDMPGGPTAQSIQANFQTWLSGPQTTGLIILEHELSDAIVQTFEAAFPLIKQYNWNLKSVAAMDGKGAYQNAPDDTSGPILVPLTAAGNGGAGLIAAKSTSTSSTPPPPSSTSSAGSKPSAHPGSGAKTGGAALGSKSSPIMLSVSTLALVFSLCLI